MSENSKPSFTHEEVDQLVTLIFKTQTIEELSYLNEMLKLRAADLKAIHLGAAMGITKEEMAQHKATAFAQLKAEGKGNKLDYFTDLLKKFGQPDPELSDEEYEEAKREYSEGMNRLKTMLSAFGVPDEDYQQALEYAEAEFIKQYPQRTSFIKWIREQQDERKKASVTEQN